jgi:hypothetical protein
LSCAYEVAQVETQFRLAEDEREWDRIDVGRIVDELDAVGLIGILYPDGLDFRMVREIRDRIEEEEVGYVLPRVHADCRRIAGEDRRDEKTGRVVSGEDSLLITTCGYGRKS